MGAGEMDLGWESLKGFSGKMVQAVIGFIGTIIFARILGPTAFGGFYFLLAMVLLADRPIRGFAQAVKKRYSEADASKSQILGGVLIVHSSIFVVVSIGAIAFERVLVASTTIESAALVFVALFVSLGIFFPFQMMLEAAGWMSKSVWNDTLRSVLTLLLQLLFVLGGFGAAGMGYGLAGASLLVVPVALYFLRIRPSVPSAETVRSLWNYAKYSIPAEFVGKAYDRFDVLLIGVILTTGAVGFYEVAYKLTVPATFLATVVTSGLMAKVSNLHSRDLDVATDVTNVVSYVSILAIPIFFGALAIPKALVVTAYGPEYTAATSLVVGLALYQVIASQTRVYQQTLSGLDLPDVKLKIDTVTLGLNIVVGIGLIYVIGVLGVVIATVIAEMARYIMSAYAVSRLIDGIDFLPRTLAKQAIAGLLMFGLVEVLDVYIAVRSWVDLVILVGIGALFYGIVLLTLSRQLRFTLKAIWTDAVSG